MAPIRKGMNISTSVLQMNFMKSTKIRLDEINERKKRRVRESRLVITSHPQKIEPAEETSDSILEDASTSCNTGWDREDSYVKLMDLREFGRFSYGGFNPEVEKEMKVWDAKRGGIPLEELDNDGKDISDNEMATTAFGQKRFHDSKAPPSEEKLLDFSYIEETTKSIKNFSSIKKKNNKPHFDRKRKSMPENFEEATKSKKSRYGNN